MSVLNNKEIKFIDFKIASDNELLNAMEYLHDSNVNESDIVFNESTGELDIIFERHYLEQENSIKTKRVFLFIGKSTFPLVNSHLHLSNITNFKKIISDKSIKTDLFNECKIKKGIYSFKFCLSWKIKAVFKNNTPLGFLKDTTYAGEAKYYTLVWPWGKL
jgi:hypothetical protein